MTFITQTKKVAVAVFIAVIVAMPSSAFAADWFAGGDVCTSCSAGWGWDTGSSHWDTDTGSNTWSWDLGSSSWNADTGSTGWGWDTGSSHWDTDTGSNTWSWDLGNATYDVVDVTYPTNTYDVVDVTYPTNVYDVVDVTYPVSGGNTTYTAPTYTYRPAPTVNIVTKPATSNFSLDYRNAVNNYNYGTRGTTGGTTVVNNNTNTVTVPQQPVVYNYTQPTSVVYNYPQTPVVNSVQTRYTPAYDYVNIASVPYTGTSDVVYVLTLVAIALLAVTVAVYYRRDLATAYAQLTGSPMVLSEMGDDDSHEDEGDDQESIVEDADTAYNDSKLTLVNDENGPRLAFVK